MAWKMSSRQIHNTLGSLGVRQGDTYNVSDDCLDILEDILRKLALEDQTLRTFRRAIGFGQNIHKDLIPLLIFVKDDTKITDATKIIDTTIKILVNLTIPVECLLSIEAVSRTDVGRHTIFELNKLLSTSKEAFTDSRSTKAVVDHIKHMVETDSNLTVHKCDSINNCLLLLRNVLHIPEDRISSANNMGHSSMQNEIIWNLFTQSIDKIIIYLISCAQKACWSVTMVQLIALIYKDQHVGTLQKLLNIWLETSLSESSGDNESNTSPDQESGDSSPVITSDPTSDSSDNGGRRKTNDRNKCNTNTENLRNKTNTADVVRAVQSRSKTLAGITRVLSTETEISTSSGVSSMCPSTESSCSVKGICQQSPSLMEQSDPTIQQSINNGNYSTQSKKISLSSPSEISDCGYVTQVENQESISTSSNDDDLPQTKPVHQKPHTFAKCRSNNQKNRTITIQDKKELRRKKLVKRSKTNIINMKGLMHHTPTDEDISNILKEFTVDFLLKGYGNLVHDLHSQLLTNPEEPIDTSHFFWLVTYFLKFATQLELDLEHIRSVLSYDIMSYLIFQGVYLYEELEISCNMYVDLRPCLRRLHLVITAIREFIQATEMYQKHSHLNEDDKLALIKLQSQIILTKDLRQLFVLLLRQYNPMLHSRQYLEDLIVTNHNYLMFLENTLSLEKCAVNLMEHLKQFASVEIMKQYGLLLEKFEENGEFVNNCVFTMMHHIGGDLEQIFTLFQPNILKTFSQIWETDFEICDDWSDLIEHVIHKFINSPRSNQCSNITSPMERSEGDNLSIPPQPSTFSNSPNERMQEDDNDIIIHRTVNYAKMGLSTKTNISIIKIILETNMNRPSKDFTGTSPSDNEQMFNGNATQMRSTENVLNGDVKVLLDHLYRDNRGTYINWLQDAVIEACFVKLLVTNTDVLNCTNSIMEPTVYYYTLLHLPIPIVSWTSEQSNSLKHQPFALLLHKLGFYLPADTGKVFLRIPNFWTADYLFNIAQQLGPIDSGKLKFDSSLLEGQHITESAVCNSFSTYNGQRRFSLTDLRNTLALVRYTPLPNSAEWVHTTPQSKSSSESPLPINHKLTIKIPQIESLPCNLPPPKLTLVKQSNCEPKMVLLQNTIDMDISSSDQEDILQTSVYDETESVTSNLTRMCVSDEEDKVVFVNHSTNI